MGLSYVPDWADSKLTLRMDIFNLFNAQQVSEFDEQGDVDRANPRRNPDYLTPVNYQTPRRVQLSARYQF